MRSGFNLFRSTMLGLSAVAILAAAPAVAGSLKRDRAYADSFGNLVIESAAGYKRIIVGEGELAKKLSGYLDTGQAKVDGTKTSANRRDCYRPPVFVKGRSYMYGLSDGEMPDISPCQ